MQPLKLFTSSEALYSLWSSVQPLNLYTLYSLWGSIQPQQLYKLYSRGIQILHIKNWYVAAVAFGNPVWLIYYLSFWYSEPFLSNFCFKALKCTHTICLRSDCFGLNMPWWVWKQFKLFSDIINLFLLWWKVP